MSDATTTSGGPDDAVEQRTLRAFDGGIDGREAGEGDDTELRERIEKAEEDIEALRELLDTAVDTISELSDSMTGHDTNDDDEANSDYEPAPETAETVARSGRTTTRWRRSRSRKKRSLACNAAEVTIL